MVAQLPLPKVAPARIVGTVAAAVAVLGVVAAPFVVEGHRPYWLSVTLAVVVVGGAMAVAARLLWPDSSVAARIFFCLFSALVGAPLTFIALFVAGMVLATHNVCTADGSEGAPVVAWVVAAVLYGGIGAAGFQRRGWLPLAWALAGIAGAAAFYVLTLAFPAGHGFCET